jgi:hypothetical protein
MKIRSSLLLATTLVLASLTSTAAVQAGCPGNRTVAVRPTPCPPPAARSVVRQTPCPVVTRPISVRQTGGCQAPAAFIPAQAVGSGGANWRAINAALRQQGYALHRVGGNFEARALPGTRP